MATHFAAMQYMVPTLTHPALSLMAWTPVADIVAVDIRIAGRSPPKPTLSVGVAPPPITDEAALVRESAFIGHDRNFALRVAPALPGALIR
jgi:hypothetical protein